MIDGITAPALPSIHLAPLRPGGVFSGRWRAIRRTDASPRGRYDCARGEARAEKADVQTIWSYADMRSVIALAVTLVVLGTVAPRIGSACSCIWVGPLATVGPTRDVVLRGKVLSHDRNSIHFEVVEVLFGDEDRAHVRIWGDNGILCRPYVERFPAGSDWVIAANRCTPSYGLGGWRTKSEPDSLLTDYYVSVCGEHSVPVFEGYAVGWITSSRKGGGVPDSIAVADLRSVAQGWKSAAEDPHN